MGNYSIRLSPYIINIYMLNDENKVFLKNNHKTGMIIEDYAIQSLRTSQEI